MSSLRQREVVCNGQQPQWHCSHQPTGQNRYTLVTPSLTQQPVSFFLSFSFGTRSWRWGNRSFLSFGFIAIYMYWVFLKTKFAFTTTQTQSIDIHWSLTLLLQTSEFFFIFISYWRFGGFTFYFLLSFSFIAINVYAFYLILFYFFTFNIIKHPLYLTYKTREWSLIPITSLSNPACILISICECVSSFIFLQSRVLYLKWWTDSCCFANSQSTFGRNRLKAQKDNTGQSKLQLCISQSFQVLFHLVSDLKWRVTVALLDWYDPKQPKYSFIKTCD